MSTSLFDELNELISDETSQVEYKHEIAISSFTNNLARLMQEHDMSQADLARRLRVSRARVSQLMQHVSSPTLRTMVELANVFGCDISPTMAPCGFRPARFFVADGGKSVAGYSQTRQISETIKGQAMNAERIAS